jgi:hypothetical protein
LHDIHFCQPHTGIKKLLDLRVVGLQQGLKRFLLAGSMRRESFM